MQPLPRPPRNDEPVARLKLAVDLGTSACAVAARLHVDRRATAAKLSFRAGDEDGYQPVPTIGSTVYFADDGTLVMDDAWIGRYRVKTGKTGGETYRSVKRELFEHYHLDQEQRDRLRFRLKSIFEELLWLAIDPTASSTVKALAAAGFDEAVAAWKANGGFGNEPFGGVPVKESAKRHGFDLCVCVPNALMAGEVAVLVTAAKAAAKEFLNKLRASERHRPYEPVITTIREAEAVAWALARRGVDAKGDVVILDVGAGTTDAALVHYGRFADDRRIDVVEFRTGTPFGGDDLDLLLLCAAWATPSTVTAGLEQRQVVAHTQLSPAERHELIGGVRSRKERWVVDAGDASVTVGVEEDRSPKLTAVEPADIDVEVYTRAPGGAATLHDVGSLRQLSAPHLQQPYRDFLRYTVLLSCAALFRRLRGHRLDAIVLTGQGSLALGIRPYVAALAEHHGIVVAPEQIRHLAAGEPEVMKLVCVEGAARYAAEVSGESDTLGEIVPETFVLIHDDWERTDLFAAGSRSQRHQVNAYIRGKFGLPRHICRYYCSPLDLPAADLSSDWARKPIATIPPDPDRRALAFRLDLRKEEIDVWTLDTAGSLTQSPYHPIGPSGRNPTHPFLQVHGQPLPLTWQAKR